MNRIIRKTTLWVLVVLTAGASAAVAGGLDERIDIALNDADGHQVLQSFGQILEADEVRIDPAIEGDITITLDNNRVRTVLDAVCDTLGCRWRFEDGTLSFEPDPDYTPPEEADSSGADRMGAPIDLVLKDASFRDVLEMFGRIAKMKVAIAPQIGGQVTVDIHETPARTALDQLCKVQGCRWEIVDDEGGPVLRVSPAPGG